VTSENIVAVLVTSTETDEQALAAASASTTLRASMHRNPAYDQTRRTIGKDSSHSYNLKLAIG
jgi:hypothetical protein